MIKTPKQIVQKYHGKDGIEPIMLTLDIDEIVKLIKKYHAQFRQSDVMQTRTVNEKYKSRIKEHAKSIYDYAKKL